MEERPTRLTWARVLLDRRGFRPKVAIAIAEINRITVGGGTCLWPEPGDGDEDLPHSGMPFVTTYPADGSTPASMRHSVHLIENMPGGRNRSSQHQPRALTIAARQVPLPGPSTPVAFPVGR